MKEEVNLRIEYNLGTDHLTWRGLEGGGYGFLFHSEFFFWTTQELEYLFFLSRIAQFFLQNLALDFMTKTLNQIITSPLRLLVCKYK
jgi:hypothetical protein